MYSDRALGQRLVAKGEAAGGRDRNPNIVFAIAVAVFKMNAQSLASASISSRAAWFRARNVKPVTLG